MYHSEKYPIDPEAVAAFVARQRHGHLIATPPGGYPQVSILPFVKTDDEIELHCVQDDPTFAAVQANPYVTFFVSDFLAASRHDWVDPQDAARATLNFRAVSFACEATTSTDPGDVAGALARLLAAYEPDAAYEPIVDGDFYGPRIRRLAMIRLRIVETDAKFKVGPAAPVAVKRSVVAGLRARGEPGDARAADVIEATLPKEERSSVGFRLRPSYRWKPLRERTQAEAYATNNPPLSIAEQTDSCHGLRAMERGRGEEGETVTVPSQTGAPLSAEVLARRAALPIKFAPVTLIGAFVRLQPLDLDRDGDALHAVSNGQPARLGDREIAAYDADALIWRYMPVGPFADADALRNSLRAQVKAPNGLCLCVFDQATGRQVGAVNFMTNMPEHLKVELGSIWYSPLVQRTQASLETTFLMLRHAFDLGYRRVEWKCDAFNERSRRSALRMGFQFEGIQEAHYIVKGRNRDTAWFRILDHEWPAVKAWLDAMLKA